jgi:hypothetical protein
MKKQQPPALTRTLKENGKRKVSTVTVNRNNDSTNNFFSKRTVETPRKKVVETDISNGDARNPANKSTFIKETKNKSILRTNISGPKRIQLI